MVHTHTHTHTYIHTHTHAHTHTRTHIHTHTYTHIHTHTYTHTHTHIHTYTHTYIHTYTHTYIYTYTRTIETYGPAPHNRNIWPSAHNRNIWPYNSQATAAPSRLADSFVLIVAVISLLATASEGLAQGPYVAARAGFEPTTLRTKGVESTNEPLRLTRYHRSLVISASIRGVARQQSRA